MSGDDVQQNIFFVLEHRNMPLDDALALIVKNFEAYMKGERSPVIPPVGAVPVTAAGIPLGDKHPEMIQALLNILVENRPLTVLQYEKIIGYLQEKKDHLVKSEPTKSGIIMVYVLVFLAILRIS